MSGFSLEYDTLLAARDAIRAGKVSSQELTRRVLERIERIEPKVLAFNSTWGEQALEQARAVDEGQRVGELAGVLIAIKDNLCTKVGTTTCSSKMLKDFRAPYDATVVKKLEAAGAVIVGKTNMDEFAMGSSTENSAFAKTRNPWDLERVPGGSSGGSAAALAAGMCCGSIGSDTGGSIREPAALCSLVGLKPTYGRVSRYGLVAFASSLDQIGPFGWTVADCALLMNVIAGHDPKDSTSVSEAVPDHLAELDRPIKGLRIGISGKYEEDEAIHPEVRAAFDAAMRQYQELGAELVEVSLPNSRYAVAAYYIIAPCEASSNLARYDGIHYGHRTKKATGDSMKGDIVELVSRSRAEGFGEEVKRRIMIGTYALSSGYYEAYYLRALKVRQLIRGDYDRAFERCDVIAMPTSPTPAFRIGEKSKDPLEMYLTDVFTVSANIAGIAGISVPCGFTSDAKPLPIGLELVGPVFSEPKLLRIARMYEAATEWHTRRPGL